MLALILLSQLISIGFFIRISFVLNRKINVVGLQSKSDVRELEGTLREHQSYNLNTFGYLLGKEVERSKEKRSTIKSKKWRKKRSIISITRKRRKNDT
jgi:hypothetical protein